MEKGRLITEFCFKVVTKNCLNMSGNQKSKKNVRIVPNREQSPVESSSSVDAVVAEVNNGVANENNRRSRSSSANKGDKKSPKKRKSDTPKQGKGKKPRKEKPDEANRSIDSQVDDQENLSTDRSAVEDENLTQDENQFVARFREGDAMIKMGVDRAEEAEICSMDEDAEDSEVEFQ